MQTSFQKTWLSKFETLGDILETGTGKILLRAFNSTCLLLNHRNYSMESYAETLRFEDLVEELINVEGFKPVDGYLKTVKHESKFLTKILMRESAFIILSPRIHEGSNFDLNFCCANIEAHSIDQNLILRIRDLFNKLTIKTNSLKNINFITNSPDGIHLSAINNFKTEPLVRENYQDYVLKGFDSMVKQIMSPDPNGRLHLLEGPPGTGKTRFISALVSEVEAKFIFVPVIEAHGLLSPDFMSLLSYEVAEHGVPIVIILEDSEALLQKRKRASSGEAAMISGILNLCDSPIAAGLNLHIISTFNAKLDEFDDAIKRKGRLATHIKFSELSYEHAKAIYEREIGGGTGLPEERSYTLAEVYSTTKETEVEFLPEEKKSDLGVYN